MVFVLSYLVVAAVLITVAAIVGCFISTKTTKYMMTGIAIFWIPLLFIYYTIGTRITARYQD